MLKSVLPASSFFASKAGPGATKLGLWLYFSTTASARASPADVLELDDVDVAADVDVDVVAALDELPHAASRTAHDAAANPVAKSERRRPPRRRMS